MDRARHMHLTEALVALVERVEPDPGPEVGSVEHTAEDFAALALEVLARRPDGPFWLFAYGSLIWKPEFDAVETMPATARGWHRAFCLKLTRWRGTREVPALMLALDRGGSCAGLAYRLTEEDLHTQVVRLLERETDGNPPTNVPRWIKIQTSQGPTQALAFVADPAGPAYAGRLPLPEVAKVVAVAAGHWGSAAQYAYRTVSKLEEHGIRDRNLWRLQRLVAEEIMAVRGVKASSIQQ
jgi:glutathione-specific gamma-glutamylcyclotransferase